MFKFSLSDYDIYKKLKSELRKKIEWIQENKDDLETKNLYLHIIIDKECSYFNMFISADRNINISRYEYLYTFEIDDFILNSNKKEVVDTLLRVISK